MMNKNDFRENILQSLQSEFGANVDIVDGKTIEKPYGWIVFYNTRRYIASGDPDDALMSNAPTLFTWDGKVIPLAMHCSVPDAISLLESKVELTS